MIIYKVTNLINNKIYIGQTTRSLKKRWNCHQYKSTSALYFAIKKYGRDNFKIEEIERVNTLDELNKREEYYINLYNCYKPIGYNVACGGKNFNRTPEIRKKISEGLKGRTISKETREKISKTLTGRKLPIEVIEKLKRRVPYMTGKKHSDEVKLKMSLAKKGKPHPHSKETCRKLSFSQKSKKPILCINNNTIYYCIKEAARQLNLHRENIRKVLYNKRKHTGNYKFIFVNEDLNG